MLNLPAEKSEFVNEILKQPLIARIGTADVNNQPHVVPVWFGWDGTSLWISSYSNTRKVQDLLINPRISVSIDVAEEGGETKAVIFEGSVTLVREPRDFLKKQFHWIYERYLGKEGVMEKSPQKWINDPHNLLIRLVPEKIFTWNW
jgi:general stress protein 26